LERFEDAFREIRIAKLLDPFSVVIKSVEGSLLYLSRRFEAAIAHFQQLLKEDADFATARVLFGQALEATGQSNSAFDQYQEAMKGHGELPELVALGGRANALAGKPDEAQKAIQRLKSWPVDGMVHPYSIALIYAALDDIDETFYWLEKALSERDEDLVILKQDVRMDPLRNDPRFIDLLRSVGFPD
jgi:tetratricopeptide (TPR) repeat protein